MPQRAPGSVRVPAARSADGEAGAPSPLSVHVLGGLTASYDGAPLDLGGRRQRAVLALLVLARGDVVPADGLVDALWGDTPPPRAAGALQAYVSHLRRRLDPGRRGPGSTPRPSVLRTEGPGYAFRAPRDAVDAWRFEQAVRTAAPDDDPAGARRLLADALALWRGPAYADYSGEVWAEAETSRLTELREVARERLVAARLGCGEAAVLVPELEALVADQPLREERWRLLALALYRSHRQADALAALRRARRTLAEEHGVDPGPVLRALEQEVLSQSPSLDGPGPPAGIARPGPDGGTGPAGPGPAAPPTPAQGRAATPAPGSNGPADDLVDRDRELDALRACLADALAGEGRVALVEGPAGIGKSRLLAETRRLAGAEDALVLAARGSQLEQEFGFGVVRQLLEGVLLDPGRRARVLAGAAASAGSVFGAVPAEAAQPADGSFAVLHGLYWLTVNLAADRPVVLVVDDLQWCDTGSVRFLGYLARRLEGLPVLVVAGLRPGEEHDDAGPLAELAHDPATVPLRPAPLSPAAVDALVRRRLGPATDAAFTAACHRTTAGNPLLLRQLLRALESGGVRPDAGHADTVTAIGSRAVSSLVLLRLRRLPAPATAVARAVAVLGDRAALPAVAALAGLPEQAAATALAALARAEVLREDTPLGFVHPLVRDAVYRDLPPGERELRHEQAARVLADAGAPPEQVAAHLLQAPRRGDPWAVAVLREAAAGATERGAADGAAAYLARALDEPPEAAQRPAVLLELGRVETFGDGPAAVRHLGAAYAALPDPAQQAAAALMLARTLVFAGARGEPTAFARRAAAALPQGLVDERQGLLALERISGYMHGLDPAAWRHGEPVEVRGTGPGARMLAAEVAWQTLVAGTDRSGAVALARFALAEGVLTRVDTGLLWVVAAIVLEMADEDVDRFWDDMLADAYARGSLFTALSVHLWRGYLLWRRGDLPEAYQSLVTANEQSEMWGAPAVGAPYGEAFITGVLLDRGDVAGARTYLEQVRSRPRLGDGERLFGEAQAAVLAAEGRHADALRSLDEVAHLQTVVTNPVWRSQEQRARALAALGRTGAALDLAGQELAAARAWGAPRVVGRALRLLGELRPDAGESELREAVTLLAGTTARLEHARALLALSRSMRARRGGPAESVPLLRRALDLAGDCAADGLGRAVAAELAAAGVAVPVPVGAAHRPTTTERRVAALAAEGLGDREIAERLFLTPRSVQRMREAAPGGRPA